MRGQYQMSRSATFVPVKDLLLHGANPLLHGANPEHFRLQIVNEEANHI